MTSTFFGSTSEQPPTLASTTFSSSNGSSSRHAVQGESIVGGNSRCQNVSKNQTALTEAFKQYHGALLAPFTLLAFVMTAFYIIAMARAIRQHRVSRKFYALLLNRSVGDLIAISFNTITVVYVLFVDEVNFRSTLIQIINIFYMGCFWSAMVSYIGIGFMKLYGMARPLQYRDLVTIRRTKQLIAVSWVFFVLMVVASLVPILLSTVPSWAAWSGCRVENCEKYMYRVRNLFMVVDYCTTLVCYAATVILIRAAKRHSESIQAQASTYVATKQRELTRRRFRFPLIKLTFPVASLAVFHFPYVFLSVMLWFTDSCYYSQNFILMTKRNGVIRASLLTRMIVDAMIGFATDRELRRFFSADGIWPLPRLSFANTPGNSSGTTVSTGTAGSGGVEHNIGQQGSRALRKGSAPPQIGQNERVVLGLADLNFRDHNESSKKRRAKTVKITAP